MTNWKRKENLKEIIENIRNQSVPVEIFLWNNNPEDLEDYSVDLQINSSKNLMCLPRWFMANYANSEYVFSLDDDLCFNDSKVVEDCIKYSLKPNQALGAFGVKLRDNLDYWSSRHICCYPDKDRQVNIIKGRFLFIKKSLLKNVSMLPSEDADINKPRIEDDIFISHYLEQAYLPSFLSKRFKELPEGGQSLYRDSNHRESRKTQTKKYFK